MTIGSFSNNYSFLSNFYPFPILIFGRVFPTNEHAFQCAKATNPTDFATILLTETPGQAKRAGRKIKLTPNWDTKCIPVMRMINSIKFSHPVLAERLLATEDHELVEGNTWGDQFWGVCNGSGQNHLGKILMDVRAELRKNG